MIKAFNSLKGILALMIFVHHLGIYDGGGSLAVSIFFMLGGFLSVLGYKERILEPNFSYKNYILGKVIKFYPMHWLLLLTAIPFIFNESKHLLKETFVLCINASLLQSWIPIQTVYFSGNAVSWYLSNTIAFVAIFPFLLKWLLLGSKKSKVYITIGITVTYIMLWIIIPQDYTHRFFYINPLFRIIDYMVGMVTALCYLKIKDNQDVKENLSKHLMLFHVLVWICFISLVAISFANEYIVLHSAVSMLLCSILLIAIALSGGGILQLPILQKFGSISFAFFLVHQICIRYLHIILGKLEWNEIYIIAPIAFVLTTVVSLFLTYKFEKNISIWLKSKILNQQSMIVR